MSAPSPKYTGACLCGAVRFTIAGPPKWVAHCHCTMCRRAHGAPYVTWAGFVRSGPNAAASFTLDAGAGVLRRYESTPAGTGQGAWRSSCSVCGSPLFFEGERWAHEIHVALASLTEPHDLVPKAHAYWDDRARWVHVDDGLKRFGGASGNTPRA